MTARYRALASSAALAAAAGGGAYSIVFVVNLRAPSVLGAGLTGALLALGGLLTSVVAVGLYRRLGEIDSSFALLALVFGVVAGLGASIHGAYDVAVVLHQPASLAGDVPNQVDPRGFLTFAVAGLSVLLFSWLISQDPGLPSRLAYLGYLSGALLVVIYLGRLIVLTSSSPAILVPAALEGLVVNPLWYVWLGLRLRAEETQVSPASRPF